MAYGMNRAGRRARAKIERRKARRTAMTSGAVLTLGAWLLTPTPGVRAATGPTVVTTTDDGAPADDGETTLREAIENADGDVAPDTITFEAGLSGTITLDQGALVVNTSMTITGPGITVSGGEVSRVFDLVGTGAAPIDVTLEGLTISDGVAAVGGGGGIRGAYASLTLDGTTVSGNQAVSGGGVSLGSGRYDDQDPALVLRASTVSGNSATTGPGGGIEVNVGKYSTVLLEDGSEVSGNTATEGSGGGIHVLGGGAKYAASVVIDASTVSGNTARNDGGGIFIDADKYGGVALLDGSVVSGNTALFGNGGGIFAVAGKYAQVDVLEGSVVDANKACDDGLTPGGACDDDEEGKGYGGGIFVYGGARLDDATVSGNFADADGGGIYVDARSESGDTETLEAAAVPEKYALTVTGSTIAGNDADNGGGVAFLGPATAEFVNSTISGNDAVEFGGGVAVGGTPEANAGLVVRFTTVTGNTAGDDGGGAILYEVEGTADHTILANNVVDDGTAEGVEVAAGDGVVIEPVFNLIEGTFDTDISTGTLTPEQLATNIQGEDPLLGDLADNGGPTETHALLPGSPAINAGDPEAAPPPDTDQRGLPREVGPPDIGAFEVQPAPVAAGVTIQFQSPTASVNEDAGPAQITLTRTGDTSAASTVRIRSTDGTATSVPPAFDFVAVDQVVSFAAGATSAVVPVTIEDDPRDEDNETFTLTLSDVTGGALGSVSAATVTIVDDVDICPPSFVMPFDDVPQANTHFESIRCIAFLGITNGASEDGTKYEPDGEVSRAQMARFIANLLELHGVELPSSPPNRFRDDNGTEHELQINQLAALGIVDGLETDPTLFNPGGNRSRAHMAKFLVGAYEEVTGTEITGTQNNFDDDNGMELEPEINAGFENQLFEGRAPRVYSPTTTVRRDQMASFLINLVDRLTELGFPPNPS